MFMVATRQSIIEAVYNTQRPENISRSTDRICFGSPDTPKYLRYRQVAPSQCIETLRGQGFGKFTASRYVGTRTDVATRRSRNRFVAIIIDD